MSDYYTLIAALPWLPELEQCKQLPLSRIALDQRLTMLSEQDKEQLALVEQLYQPNLSQIETLTDREIVAQWMKQLQQVASPLLVERITYYLELKTLLAALRNRAAGLENPALFFGYGRWLLRIRKHWFEPGFGLESVCPELQLLQRVLAKNNPLAVEKMVNQLLWHDLLLMERTNYFSFEALVCFVLRWNLAENHLRQNSETALEQFIRSAEQLLEKSGLDSQLSQGIS